MTRKEADWTTRHKAFKSTRNLSIFRDYNCNLKMTLKQQGDKHGIGVERIRTILIKMYRITRSLRISRVVKERFPDRWQITEYGEQFRPAEDVSHFEKRLWKDRFAEYAEVIDFLANQLMMDWFRDEFNNDNERIQKGLDALGATDEQRKAAFKPMIE